jgi:hypothetical protein
VAIADLDEAEVPGGSAGFLSERARVQDSSRDAPNHSCPGPGHAFQKSAPVDAVFLMIVNNLLGQVASS